MPHAGSAGWGAVGPRGLLDQVAAAGLRGRGQRPVAAVDDRYRRVRDRRLRRVDGDRRAVAGRGRAGQQGHAQAGRDQVADAGRAVGLERDPRGEAGLTGGRQQDVVQAAAGRQADERVVAQPGQGRDRPVAGRQRQDQVLGGYPADGEARGQIVVAGGGHPGGLAGAPGGRQAGEGVGAQRQVGGGGAGGGGGQ